MPRTKSSLKYISEIREDIDYWLDRAKKIYTTNTQNRVEIISTLF